MARTRKKIGEILQSWGIVDAAGIEKAVDLSKKNNLRIGDALVQLELCSDEDVTKALASQNGMEYVDLSKDVIVPQALKLVPEKIIKERHVLPMSMEGGVLKVVVHDPNDLDTLDLIRFRCGATDVIPTLAPKVRIQQFIDKYIDSPATSIDKLAKSLDVSMDTSIDQDAPIKGKDATEDADAPIIRLLNMMISEAVRSRASDIHVEPMADRVRVRYRIDGVCVERENIPKRMQGPVTTRLKIMAGIDIAERRVPQDGRIKLAVSGQDIDFRVSSCPHVHGESIVLRILRPDSVRVGIQALGFEEDDYQHFLKIIKRPNGIFLVTGPTGSGKTTTLYAALQELNRPDKKIITAEDPVEYNFTGINQCQVKEDIGLGFDRILRSMLRQAPNIILVGEIRDLKVGEIAIQAALTGHLVFSTLHTNDAPSAITRLIDMGIKPFLVASSIQAIMAQRLVRIICQECKVPDTNPDPLALKLCGFTPEELAGQTLWKGRGCAFCHNTGYRGRKGIFEMMQMNSEVRELAFNRAPTAQIRKAARAAGMRTLLDDGKRKILKGTTTADEVARITQAEGIADM